jgi:hypothetical protein
MKYEILVAAPAGPCPLGTREADAAPEIGDVLEGLIDGEERRLEVVGIQLLPVVSYGTFKHDQIWVLCRLL